MMLQYQLAAHKAWRDTHFPADLRQAMEQSYAELRQAGWSRQALKVGEAFPDLSMLDCGGCHFSLSRLLGKTPLIVCFLCGHWSPYCNLELRALNQLLPQFQATGARLIPIVSQSVSLNFSTQRCNRLNFQLFSDLSLDAARACGLVMPLPPLMIDAMEQLGIDLPGLQAGRPYELPIPASYVIDQQGIIQYAFVDEDLRERAEPADLLQVLQKLSPHG